MRHIQHYLLSDQTSDRNKEMYRYMIQHVNYRINSPETCNSGGWSTILCYFVLHTLEGNQGGGVDIAVACISRVPRSTGFTVVSLVSGTVTTSVVCVRVVSYGVFGPEKRVLVSVTVTFFEGIK